MRFLIALLSPLILSMSHVVHHRSLLFPAFIAWSMIHIASFVQAENCTLCADGSFPGDPNAKFTYTKNGQNQAITCEMGYTEAPKGEFASCSDLQNRTSTICQCGTKNTTSQCNLCYLGESLPNPSKVIANRTCAYWQWFANTYDFVSNCPAWQKTFGYHCGCATNSEMLVNFCSLCGTNRTIEKPLPDPNTVVKYTDGSSDYCVTVERVLNSKQFPQCLQEQTKYNNACGCNIPPGGSKPNASVPSVLAASFAAVWLPSLFVMSFLL